MKTPRVIGVLAADAISDINDVLVEALLKQSPGAVGVVSIIFRKVGAATAVTFHHAGSVPHQAALPGLITECIARIPE